MNNAMETSELIKAFDLMWDNHPSPVMLLNKKHEIVSVNAVASALGIAPGGNCFSLAGNKKMCSHCKAPVALKQGKAMRSIDYSAALEKVIDGYWIPVKDSDEFYVHFGNDITPQANPDMFPQIK